MEKRNLPERINLPNRYRDENYLEFNGVDYILILEHNWCRYSPIKEKGGIIECAFIDPSGGPFLHIGDTFKYHEDLKDKIISRIYVEYGNEYHIVLSDEL